MRRPGPAVLAMLLLAAAGCGRRSVHVPAKPIVLWSAGAPEPEFSLPPEARWQPVYQKLRRELAHRSGKDAQWVCFSSGKLPAVLAFYARKYGPGEAKKRVTSAPAAAMFATVRKVAADLGHPVPPSPVPPGRVRIIILPQRGNLPRVRLESPFLDLETGRVERGTLISMRWRKPGP